MLPATLARNRIERDELADIVITRCELRTHQVHPLIGLAQFIFLRDECDIHTRVVDAEVVEPGNWTVAWRIQVARAVEMRAYLKDLTRVDDLRSRYNILIKDRTP